MQRQITSRFTLEADYNATIGEHLNAGLMNLNQVPMSIVNSLIAQYGASQAISLLNSNILSPTAVGAGFAAPYREFYDSETPR